MKKAGRIFLVSLFLILLINSVVLANEGFHIITALELEGNQRVSTEEILTLLETEIGKPLDEEVIKADLQRIYDLGYFQDASVSFEVYLGGLKAIFELVEYPVIKDILIEGVESFSEEEILSLLGVQKGEVLNHNTLLQGRREIEQAYQEAGYILAMLTDLHISDDGILTVRFNEGYINDIILKGNEKTKDFVILRQLEFKPGDVLNMNVLQNSFQNLVRLNLFAEFNPQLERVSILENTANIIIEVAEAKTGLLSVGVTYSTKDGWLGYIDIQERNLLGNGQTLGFQWQFGGVTNYSINFYEPWLLGTRTSFGIGLYDRTSTGKLEDREYSLNRRGGNLLLGHNLINEWDGQITFKAEDTEREWLADKEIEKKALRSLTFQVDRDTTNHPFNPTGGAIDIFSIEYAGNFLGGTENFVKYNMDMRRFYPGFKSNHAWALRLKAGKGEGELPQLEKYTLGGSQSLRGYEYGAFYGDSLLLLNLEYRLPIADNFTAVVFADAGNVWEKEESIDLGDLRYSIGAGLRMNTPIGQLRLDYGFNEDGGGQPHFSIGHTF
ncbi:MAG TPA: BamA/TamA family outer membrane protein [Halanaerobiaceae bacterium]|nr:BamA/TamA family outer membrane protein [Bacillota bacterium]HHU92066.1 BamA/TamA family outer membrane protein [Halanaerobiaceae bacterium]